MKDSIKSAVGLTLFASCFTGVFLRNTAVVVAFHRVRNTATTDGLTVSVPVFERYCQFFNDHFQVVSLREIISRLESGQKLNRELAITFDDGYLDNFENAAPVLDRLSLPATFFVVSQWIGTDLIPWWDRQQGVRYPWMNWDQVRTLTDRGFDIGAHTRTHVDLGAADESDAREEIFGARFELERRLNHPIELFAYPYGRRSNIADSSRHLVKAAGFRCCCSCFGGVIGPGTDPFDLPRVPISLANSSPLEFGFEVALGRSVLPA